MGVVYKLKEKVLLYIIDQKKENPDLSCRSMVNMVYKKFKMDISKSSINSVMKDADLSSPVGRRIGTDMGAKKFTIPKERKRHILNESLKKKVGLTGVKISKRPLTKKRPSPLPAPPIPRHIKKPKPDKVKSPQTFKQKRPMALPQDQLDKGVYYDGMGAFFLKAAEWSLSKNSVFGDVLENHIEDFSASEIRDVSEVLVFMEIFGIHEPSDIVKYGNQGLWALNGFKGVLDYRLLLNIIEQIKDIKGFNMEMSNLISQLVEEINVIKIKLSDSTSFSIDAQLNSVWKDNVHSEMSLPNQKVIESMSKQIVNNLKPTTICSVPGVNHFSPEFYEFVASYENVPKKTIKKISLLDNQNQGIADFSTIPSQRRHFIVGAWPWQEEFKRLEMESANLPTHHFFEGTLQREVHFNELYSNFANEHIEAPISPLRVFLLRESDDGEAIAAVICNISAKEASPERVISSYLLQWPNLQRGHSIFALRNAEATQPENQAEEVDEAVLFLNQGGTANLRSNFHHFLMLLNRYCKRHFFPFHYNGIDVDAIKSIVYNVPGFLKQTPEALTVRLVIPTEGYLYREDLEYSIKRVNEGNIQDPQGRKLFIFIDS